MSRNQDSAPQNQETETQGAQLTWEPCVVALTHWEGDTLLGPSWQP